MNQLGKNRKEVFLENVKQLNSQSKEIRAFEEVEAKLGRLKCNTTQDIIRHWNEILIEREKIQSLTVSILKTNIRTFAKANLDQKLWKASFYNYISIIRYDLKCPKAELNDKLSFFINDGLKFFLDLLGLIEKVYFVPISRFKIKNEYQPSIDKSDPNFYLYLTIYKLFIFIGDLYRYKYLISREDNLIRSFESYDSARWTDPRKGRAFYQLGIISKIKGDFLGATYYFWRSFLAPGSAEGSRNELMNCYDDSARLYRKEESSYWHLRSRIMPQKDVDKFIRREIWCTTFVDGAVKKLNPPSPLAETLEEHFSELLPSAIWKRFSFSFNFLFHKLFTRIDADNVEFIAEDTLVYFERVLNRTNYFTLARATQITYINICIIEHLNSLKVEESNPQQMYLLDIYKNFTLELFGILVRTLERLVDLCDWDNPLFEPVASALHIWSIWLQMNMSYLEKWVKPRSMCSFSPIRIEKRQSANAKDLNSEDDVWTSFAQLATKLEIIFLRFSSLIFPKVGIHQSTSTKIPVDPLIEYLFLEGTKMINEVSQFKFYTSTKYRRNRTRNYIRLYSLYKFAALVLASKKFRVLKKTDKAYDGVCKYKSGVKYVLSALVPGLDDNNLKFWTLNKEGQVREVVKRNVKPDCNNARVILRKMKRCIGEGEEEMAPPPPARIKMESYEMWTRISDMGFPTELIIDPKRIVIDTNCFLRNLSNLRRLMNLIRIPVCIPLTVLLELKGLQKGGLSKKYVARYGSSTANYEAHEMLIKGEILAEAAKEALAFIDSRLGHFQIVSFTGKVMKVWKVSSRMYDDYFDSNMRNDDRILETVKYLETKDLEARRKDSPRRIFRHTLMITGDRGLRVKANSLDIPSREVNSVLYWSSCVLGDVRPNFSGRRRFWSRNRRRRRPKKQVY